MKVLPPLLYNKLANVLLLAKNGSYNYNHGAKKDVLILKSNRCDNTTQTSFWFQKNFFQTLEPLVPFFFARKPIHVISH